MLSSFHAAFFWALVCVGVAIIREQTCDFETAESCEWLFTNLLEVTNAERRELESARHNQPSSKTYTNQSAERHSNIDFIGVRTKDMFNVVAGMPTGRNSIPNHYAYYYSKDATENVGMIVSPYFQHSSQHCSVGFNYRIIGEPGAHLLVTTQLLPFHVLSEEAISPEEAEDWIRPTQQRTIAAVSSMNEMARINVAVGEISYPTRIRIECHSSFNEQGQRLHSGNDMDVECFVDDIRMENCAEHVWQPNLCTMDSKPRRYLCHKHREQKCIDYADVCDMHDDCANREDEDNKIHNCKLAPQSARCTFEDTSFEAGCENWIISNMPNAVELIRLGSPTNDDDIDRRTGTRNAPNAVTTQLPPDKTTGSNAGHYLIFSTFGNEHAIDEIRSAGTGLLYSHAQTSLYPRMDPKLKDPSFKLYGTCFVRFFYCHVGSTNFQIIIERIKTQYKKVIWTPPRASLIEPCVWEKASIELDYQPSEYFFKFGIAKMNNYKSMFLMDDFSMSPSCFLMRGALMESTLPPFIALTSCGQYGPVPPSAKQCELQTASKIDGELPISGRRTFMIDKRTEYRVEIYGAAGGQLPGAHINNYGGMIIANIMLDMADEVTLIVGQMGDIPCNQRLISAKLAGVLRIVCPTGKPDSITADAIDYPGTGGGGASAVFVNGKAIAIAGGGGGIFAGSHLGTKNENKKVSEGGNSFEYVKKEFPLRRPRREDSVQMDVSWASGNGGSFDDSTPLPSFVNCPDCGIMNGQLSSASNAKAGGCPSSRLWTVAGGFGGGGAACGPGGGGGGGYKGGKAQVKAHGSGGSSAVFAPVKKFIAKAGINDENGRIVLRACSTPCIVNATCRFEDPVDGQLPREYCECANGKRVTGNDNCIIVKEVSVVSRVKETLDATHPKTVLFFLSLICAMLLFCCFCCVLYRFQSHRRKSKAFKNFQHELQLIASDPLGVGSAAGAIVTRGSMSFSGHLNVITGNPIYQCMDTYDVPHISREWCDFNDVIGNGAFGEVRIGTMNRPSDPPFRVALKTLSCESSPEVIHDFQTEARILCNFSHPNIVRLYGVCFDSSPRFIVLELLEGGDLRNYLRECRPKGMAKDGGGGSLPTSPMAKQPPFELTMLDLLQISLDVASGCEYLECNKFVHRDIAARNCLLTSKNPLHRVVKIADFGMARDIYRNDYYRKGGRAFLPVKWMPPEAFLDGIFTYKTDVWAYGVLLWEIFSMGYTPYPGRQNQEVMQLIVNGGRMDAPLGTPDEIYAFMMRCWETNAEDRPSFRDAVEQLGEMTANPALTVLPLPPVWYKQSLRLAAKASLTSSTTEEARNSSVPPSDSDQAAKNPCTASQATISTMVASMTESTTTSSYDSMPTRGEGVSHNVCPPYETKQPRPVAEFHPLERIASGDSVSTAYRSVRANCEKKWPLG